MANNSCAMNDEPGVLEGIELEDVDMLVRFYSQDMMGRSLQIPILALARSFGHRFLWSDPDIHSLITLPEAQFSGRSARTDFAQCRGKSYARSLLHTSR